MSRHINIEVATRAIAAISREYNVEQLLHTSKALVSAEDKALRELQERLAVESISESEEVYLASHDGADYAYEARASDASCAMTTVLDQDTKVEEMSPWRRRLALEHIGFEFPLESEDEKEDDC